VVVIASASWVTEKRLGSTAYHKCRLIWTVFRFIESALFWEGVTKMINAYSL
jgi:hypothetical protein